MKNSPARSRFNKLVADISKFFEDARMAQVRFAWETGRRIVEEEQNGAIRAQYGTHLIKDLSDELSRKYGKGFSPANLAYMRRFYLENKIFQPAGKLSWANHVELLRVKDPTLRKDLEKRAVKECLIRDDLRDLIRAKTRRDAVSATRTAARVDTLTLAAPTRKLPALKRPTDLILHTYATADTGDVDCGFHILYPATASQRKKVTMTDTPSYTYVARIAEVLDGDTLRVIADVGFGILMRDKLRLRGINCPELKEPGGEEAKRFVQKRLPVGALVIIKSRKIITDNHGRFVMDVFYLGKDPCQGIPKPESDQQRARAEGSLSNKNIAQEIIKNGTYLNQELIDEGQAVRMEE